MRSAQRNRRNIDRVPVIKSSSRARVKRPRIRDITIGVAPAAAGGVDNFLISGGSQAGAVATPYYYDPAADTYTVHPETYPGGLANALQDHGILYTMRTGGTDAFHYDDTANIWELAALPSGSLTVQLIFQGGVLRNNVLELHDPATDTWSSGSSVPSGNILGASGGNYYRATADANYAYCSVRDASKVGADQYRVRRITLSDGTVTDITPTGGTGGRAEKMLVIDGKVWGIYHFGAKWWVYDIAAGTWNTTRTTLPNVDFYNFHPNVAKDRIYVWGGWDKPDYLAWQQKGWYYDIAADTWTAITAPPAVLAAGHIGNVTV